MRLLPKPASGMPLVILEKPTAKLCSKAPQALAQDARIPGRVYIDRQGNEHPWVCDQNPRMWLGQEDED